MSNKRRVSNNVVMLTDCAIMVALAFVLSCAKLFEMPMGGSITVASMLPIMLISVKYGSGVGLTTGLVYSFTQIIQAIASANVFPYCENAWTVIICVLFDYILPFTVLGLAGIFHKSKLTDNPEANLYIGITAVVFARFLCHFITGVAIWGQWAPDGMGKYLYSFLYNGGYMLVDYLICMTVTVIMLRKSEIRKLVGIDQINKA